MGCLALNHQTETTDNSALVVPSGDIGLVITNVRPKMKLFPPFISAVLTVVILSACGGSSPRALSELSGSMKILNVAAISAPTAFAVRSGDPVSVIYVASQDGVVHRVDTESGESSTAASFESLTVAGGERGLLGLAFSPAGDEMYAHYTNLDGDTTVVATPFADGLADVGAARVLLFVDQPFPNHNGGQLFVDPQGNLLIGLGDGGAGGDPLGNAQNPASLLGKILRIAPNPAGSSQPYSIPSDNPFIGSNSTAPEIAFLGLRNPWRFSIDATTGDFWIADVGQSKIEEINHVAASALGANFGWNVKEGSEAFKGSTTEDLTDPVHEWRNVGGSSAIGGFVYRGEAIAGLRGLYIFADLGQSGLFVLDPTDNSVVSVDVPMDSVVGFGVDNAGEVYLLSYSSGVSKLVPQS
jgi:glucose/arabinose dehydrogenase